MIRTLAFCLVLLAPLRGGAEDVTVFAAASLSDALGAVAEAHEAETGVEVVLVLGGSSALARQIEQGAPADLFLSANPGWMDRLERAGRLAPGTRRDLLGNRLVLIGPEGAAPVSLGPEIAERLDGRVLAMALTEAVPAGIYGRAALEHLGLWAELAPEVAETRNVRAALALVATGAAPLGIVYRTDALAEPRVAELAVFPEGSHPPIIYPVAGIAGRQSAAAAAFLDYLTGPEAAAIFAAHGFLPPGARDARP